MSEILATGMRRVGIVRLLSRETLNRMYDAHLRKKRMHPAQWFGDAAKWYRIHTFNNPYNAGRPNAELALLIENRHRLLTRTAGLPMVFWGVGKSDTEMEFVNLQIGGVRRDIHVAAVDINHTFLGDFARALKDKVKECPRLRIHFFGIRGLFEIVRPKDLKGLPVTRRVHVCLGNTVGNYSNTDEIIRVFSRNAERGDFLILGYQTDHFIQSTVMRYRGNGYFESLLRSAMPPRLRKRIDGEKMEWRFNPQRSQVEAWLHGVEVFRSKKFNPGKLRERMLRYGFALKVRLKDRYTTCIDLYQKTTRE